MSSDDEVSKNCKEITLDFIIKENDPEVAAIEDDVSDSKRRKEHFNFLNLCVVYDTHSCNV